MSYPKSKSKTAVRRDVVQDAESRAAKNLRARAADAWKVRKDGPKAVYDDPADRVAIIPAHMARFGDPSARARYQEDLSSRVAGLRSEILAAEGRGALMGHDTLLRLSRFMSGLDLDEPGGEP